MPDCAEVLRENLSLSRCKLPGMIKGMITAPYGTSITPANFQSLSAWRTLLLSAYSSRVFLWPWFKKIEQQSSETTYELTVLSASRIHNGSYRWKVFLRESLCLHKKLYTHNTEGGDMCVFLIDVFNNIIGTVMEDGNITGFSLDLINAEKLLLGDGSVSTMTPVMVCLRDNTELDEQGIMYKVSFLNQLYRIVDVEITDFAHTLDDVRVVDVAAACDGTAIIGLVAADFLVLDAAGVSVGAVTTAVEDANVPGRYTLTKANSFVVGGSVTLLPPSTLSIKAYEAAPMDDIVSVS